MSESIDIYLQLNIVSAVEPKWNGSTHSIRQKVIWIGFDGYVDQHQETLGES